MITLQTEPIILYSESAKYNLSFVMHQTIANEQFRLDLDAIKFDFKKSLNDKYSESEGKIKTLKNTVNYKTSPKQKRTIDFEAIKLKNKKIKELDTFNKKLREYIDVTTFITSCFSQNEELETKIVDACTEFDDKFLIVKG